MCNREFETLRQEAWGKVHEHAECQEGACSAALGGNDGLQDSPAVALVWKARIWIYAHPVASRARPDRRGTDGSIGYAGEVPPGILGGNGLLPLRTVLLTLWPRAPAPVAEAAKGEGADTGAQPFTSSLPSQDPAAAAAKVAELLRSFGVELCAPGSYVES